MRRFTRRRFGTRLARRRTEWARFTKNDVAPNATLNGYELLDSFRTAFGISINLPDITIGRLHIRISIGVHVTAALGPNDGVLVAVATFDKDDISGGTGVVSSPVAAPYDLDYMWWEELYISQQVMAGGVRPTAAFDTVLYRDLDIRSKRKLRGMGETLGVQLVASGNASITGVSLTGQALMLLPR